MEKIKYPELKLRKSDKEITEIEKEQLTCVKSFPNYTIDPYLSTLKVGDFSGYGYYLDSGYDWVIGLDKDDRKILLPLKKYMTGIDTKDIDSYPCFCPRCDSLNIELLSNTDGNFFYCNDCKKKFGKD